MAGLSVKGVTEVRTGGFKSPVHATAGAEGVVAVVAFFTWLKKFLLILSDIQICKLFLDTLLFEAA